MIWLPGKRKWLFVMVVSGFLFWLTIKIMIVILTTNTFILLMLKRKCVNRKPGKRGSGA